MIFVLVRVFILNSKIFIFNNGIFLTQKLKGGPQDLVVMSEVSCRGDELESNYWTVSKSNLILVSILHYFSNHCWYDLVYYSSNWSRTRLNFFSFIMFLGLDALWIILYGSYHITEFSWKSMKTKTMKHS